MGEVAMNENELSRQVRGLYTLAMVNVGIWTIAMIALVAMLQNGGNLKGMFVILAGGAGIGIQMISLLSKLRKG